MKRGSALLLALFLIATLSVIVLSFAFEAHQQAGINIFVRERNRVNRLIEPGRIIGEMIMLGYRDAKDPEIKNGEPDWKEIFEEEDRWCKEKYALKHGTSCKIGPILLDEEDPDSGTVTVEIETSPKQGSSDHENGININELYSGGDKNYALRWQMILTRAGIDEELEVEVKDADGRGSKKRNLINHLIACWQDWRDEDDNVSRGPLDEYEPEEDDGAESAWYKEYYEEQEKEAHGTREEREQVKEDRRTPRNGAIPDIKELAYIRGFRDFPSVLRGGKLYDGTELEKEYDKKAPENPPIRGIMNMNLFGTTGTAKITLTPGTSIDQLMTIPGIYPEDLDDIEENQNLAETIKNTLYVEPEDVEDRIAATDESGKKWWPYKDWQDLNTRIEDSLDTNVKLGQEASEYIEWQPLETSVFTMKITARSAGMKREVSCKCYVNSKEKKVRYIKWRED